MVTVKTMAYVKEPVTKSNLKITCEFSTIILFIPGEFLALYTPNANMADLSAGPGLVVRKRG